ncbi:helix-turn-helix domain-containing protein [Xanthobacter sediminis]
MTSDDLISIRKALGLTQAEMAERIGLGSRAYQDLEAGKSTMRKIHAEAASMVSLAVAVEKGEPMLAIPAVRKLALSLANLITEGHA